MGIKEIEHRIKIYENVIPSDLKADIEHLIEENKKLKEALESNVNSLERMASGSFYAPIEDLENSQVEAYQAYARSLESHK